jgi:hypothetical protein
MTKSHRTILESKCGRTPREYEEVASQTTNNPRFYIVERERERRDPKL